MGGGVETSMTTIKCKHHHYKKNVKSGFNFGLHEQIYVNILAIERTVEVFDAKITLA